MDATVAFYRRLGLDVPDTEPAWQAHHRRAAGTDGLNLDFDSYEFARMWNACSRPSGTGGACVVGLRLSSREAVDALHEEVTNAGSISQQAPFDTFWGARYAIVEDPDGNAVGLMSPSDPELRTTPTPP